MTEKLLFIDTETTGLFAWDKPADVEGQPRLAQFSGLLLVDNKPEARLTAYVTPDGWEMPKEASLINGLSTELLKKLGIPVKNILDWYNSILDLEPTVVAHNVRYDTKVMRGEFRRAKMEDRYTTTKTSCTLRAASPILKTRYPSLTDCIKHFLKEDRQDAHTAEADMEYCKRIYFEMQNAQYLLHSNNLDKQSLTNV